ncbi:hypothetical protein M1349_03515 [Patescibacteria group bacterium]|nr:hypothetical protein [Patescibacteria group bacterium]
MRTIQFRQSLFWDTNPKKLNTNNNARYIIERIMDFGNDDEVRWMKREYSKPMLHQVAKTSKVLQPNSKALWILLTNK